MSIIQYIKRSWLLLCLCGIGCVSEEEFIPVYIVPDEFQRIIDDFIEEAAERGVEIEIDNLVISYDDEMELNICVENNFNSNEKQKQIFLNPVHCWASYFQKEALIFHQLGHSELGRQHDNVLLPNGEPKSIMIKNDFDLYSSCIYALGDDTTCNKTYRRKYYIDELFDQDTPAPEWAIN